MTFENLSRADAERYRARIEADHEPRLAELARLLTEAGLSLDEFDGTVDSLVPVWEWTLEAATQDYVVVPPDAQFRRLALHVYDADIPARGHVSELLAHYLFEVARRCFGAAEWRVLARPGFADHQQTAMAYRDGAGVEWISYPLDYCYNVLWTLDEPGTRSPEFLRTVALKGTLRCSEADQDRVLALPRGESLLAPFLGEDESTPEFELSGPRKCEDTEPGDDGLVGDELILARSGSSVEQLERARPIDADAVAETLGRLGFIRSSGEVPTADEIAANEFTEFLLDETAMAITLAWRGKLRAVQLSSIRAYPVPWAELVGEFTALGERIGAKLAREDEF